LNDARRAEIFARLAAANPDPRSELEYASDFELLVAVILSAQATDRSVNRVTPKLFAVAGTPERMIALGLGRLKRHIRTIGLYNNKAKSIMATARALVAEHGGRVPRTREALEALPGVGRKTASVILNVAFGEPTIAVDTHIFRVANRTRLATGRTPLEVELKLLRHTPAAYRRHAHHWLILHGRYVCVARAPKCKICIINDLCEYPDKLL
jgi:endonuclease-3